MINSAAFMELLAVLHDRLYLELLDEDGVAVGPPIRWLGSGVKHHIVADRDAVVRDFVVLAERAPAQEKLTEGVPAPTWLYRGRLELDNDHVVFGQEIIVAITIGLGS